MLQCSGPPIRLRSGNAPGDRFLFLFEVPPRTDTATQTDFLEFLCHALFDGLKWSSLGIPAQQTCFFVASIMPPCLCLIPPCLLSPAIPASDPAFFRTVLIFK